MRFRTFQTENSTNAHERKSARKQGARPKSLKPTASSRQQTPTAVSSSQTESLTEFPRWKPPAKRKGHAQSQKPKPKLKTSKLKFQPMLPQNGAALKQDASPKRPKSTANSQQQTPTAAQALQAGTLTKFPKWKRPQAERNFAGPKAETAAPNFKTESLTDTHAERRRPQAGRKPEKQDSPVPPPTQKDSKAGDSECAQARPTRHNAAMFAPPAWRFV